MQKNPPSIADADADAVAVAAPVAAAAAPTPEIIQAAAKFYREMEEQLAAYASLDWVIFPLHRIIRDKETGERRCNCHGGRAGENHCPGAGKHPRVLWSQMNEPAGTRRIERWNSEQPSQGWAIHLGPSNVCVLDIDPRNGGTKSLIDLAERFGIPKTLSSTTGSGGQHFYFNDDGQFPDCTKIDLAPGVELLRGRHIAILPPSPHKSGGSYRWNVDRMPIDAPQWMADMTWEIQKAKEATGKGKAGRGGSAPMVIPAYELDDVRDRARKYVEMMPSAVSGRGGSKTTFRVACVLVLGFALSASDAFPLLAEYSNRCDPPWSERELWHKLHDAEQRGGGERGYLLSSSNRKWGRDGGDDDNDELAGFDNVTIRLNGSRILLGGGAARCVIAGDDGAELRPTKAKIDIAQMLGGTPTQCELIQIKTMRRDEEERRQQAERICQESINNSADRAELRAIYRLPRQFGCGGICKVKVSTLVGDGKVIRCRCECWVGCSFCRAMNSRLHRKHLKQVFAPLPAVYAWRGPQSQFGAVIYKNIKKIRKKLIKKAIAEAKEKRRQDKLQGVVLSPIPTKKELSLVLGQYKKIAQAEGVRDDLCVVFSNVKFAGSSTLTISEAAGAVRNAFDNIPESCGKNTVSGSRGWKLPKIDPENRKFIYGTVDPDLDISEARDLCERLGATTADRSPPGFHHYETPRGIEDVFAFQLNGFPGDLAFTERLARLFLQCMHDNEVPPGGLVQWASENLLDEEPEEAIQDEFGRATSTTRKYGFIVNIGSP